jgi:hypothetical protein
MPGAQAFAAPPPDAEMGAARAALAAAERLDPRGAAEVPMQEARVAFTQAQSAYERHRWKDALLYAEQAQASADLARARARLGRARAEVDARAARNAELRRQLLVVPTR